MKNKKQENLRSFKTHGSARSSCRMSQTICCLRAITMHSVSVLSCTQHSEHLHILLTILCYACISSSAFFRTLLRVMQHTPCRGRFFQRQLWCLVFQQGKAGRPVVTHHKVFRRHKGDVGHFNAGVLVDGPHQKLVGRLLPA